MEKFNEGSSPIDLCVCRTGEKA